MTELRNSRPFDLDKQTIDDLFEEAEQWLDEGFQIENEAQAEGIEKLLDLTRKAAKEADDHRKIEVEPIDIQRAEIQGRYNGLKATALLITDGCKAALTVWRDKLITKQAEDAEAVRKAADEAATTAQRVTEVAGTNLGAKKIAQDAQDTAERLDKTASRLEKKTGTGLRTRTVYDFEIEDIKLTIAHYYRNNPGWMASVISDAVKIDVRVNHGAPIPGIKITPRKEAY